MNDAAEPNPSFAEIRDLLRELPGPDLSAATEATEIAVRRRAPSGVRSQQEQLWIWLATWQGRRIPQLDHPRVAVFAGNHGVAPEPGAAARKVQALLADEAPINSLCRAVDADLRVYEMALDQPTNDFRRGPAMTEDECARAMAYGMMAVEPGLDLLCLAALGDGSDIAAVALGIVLFGGEARDWSDDAAAEAIVTGAAAHPGVESDPLLALRCFGGHEIAAVAGAVMAARLARIPVVLDGFTAALAASVVWALDRHGLDHCVVGQLTAGRTQEKLLGVVGTTVLMKDGISGGDGSGAVAAIPMLRASVALHNRG